MFSSDQYECLDFGDHRRLERFGGLLLDRPCPAAAHFKKQTPSLWQEADAIFDLTGEGNERGTWRVKPGANDWLDVARGRSPSWQIRHDQTVMELRPSPFGHIGLFPEQAGNWEMIQAFCNRERAFRFQDKASCTVPEVSSPPKEAFRVLNLFAYTGGSTLAAAQGGAEVVHVDAAQNVVRWAKKNAELSQIPATQVRWMAEDAPKFVRRELRRGNRYRGVILDPPSYGHGTRGEVWRLSKHLPALLRDCVSLLETDHACFLLLTCHTSGLTLPRLTELVRETAQQAIGDPRIRQRLRIHARSLTLCTVRGAALPAGESVLLERKP